MRWVFAALGVAVVAAGAVFAFAYSRDGDSNDPVALPEHAMPGRLLVGFQDDASFRWATDRAVALDAARDANAGVIRTIVAWQDAATRRPANPRDSFDPAYHFDDLDDLVRSGQQRGIELLLSIWGTPEWANGGQTPNHPPTDRAGSRGLRLRARRPLLGPARGVSGRPPVHRVERAEPRAVSRAAVRRGRPVRVARASTPRSHARSTTA